MPTRIPLIRKRLTSVSHGRGHWFEHSAAHQLEQKLTPNPPGEHHQQVAQQFQLARLQDARGRFSSGAFPRRSLRWFCSPVFQASSVIRARRHRLRHRCYPYCIGTRHEHVGSPSLPAIRNSRLPSTTFAAPSRVGTLRVQPQPRLHRAGPYLYRYSSRSEFHLGAPRPASGGSLGSPLRNCARGALSRVSLRRGVRGILSTRASMVLNGPFPLLWHLHSRSGRLGAVFLASRDGHSGDCRFPYPGDFRSCNRDHAQLCRTRRWRPRGIGVLTWLRHTTASPCPA